MFAGPILFVCLLVSLAIVVGPVAAYAAHCFRVVVHDTAAGNDAVTWPDEPFLDWVLGSVRLAALLALCLVPAGFLARALGQVWLTHDPGLRFLLLAGPTVWLIFPAGMLALLTSRSPQNRLHLSAVSQFVRLAPAILIFYFVTAILMAISLAAWRACLFGGWTGLLPLVAALGGAVLLVYARLLGRLLWLIGRVQWTDRTATRKAKRRRKAPKAEVTDPWAIPEEDLPGPDDEEDEAGLVVDDEYPELKRRGVESYDLSAEKPPPRPSINTMIGKLAGAQRPTEPIAEEMHPELKRRGVGGYALGPQGPPPLPPEKAIVNEHVLKRHLAERTRTYYVPPHPLITGVYNFPWYGTSLKAWLVLTLGGTLVGALVLAMSSFFPF